MITLLGAFRCYHINLIVSKFVEATPNIPVILSVTRIGGGSICSWLEDDSFSSNRYEGASIEVILAE